MRRAGRPHRLDRLVDGGMVGRGVAEEELVEAEAKGGKDRRVEPAGRALGKEGDRGIGGSPPLDRAVGEPLRLGALPAGEAAASAASRNARSVKAPSSKVARTTSSATSAPR